MKTSRITHEATAVEWMKKAPITQAVVPQMRLDCTVYRLRMKGWPITCELRSYYTAEGMQELRAEFRLGNWTARALAMQTAPVLKQSET